MNSEIVFTIFNEFLITPNISNSRKTAKVFYELQLVLYFAPPFTIKITNFTEPFGNIVQRQLNHSER